MRPERSFAFVLTILLFALCSGVALGAQYSPPAGRNAGPPPPDEQTYPPNAPVEGAPSVLTLPAGTLITVRTTQPLSSDHNRPGDGFTTVLDQPVVAQGWIVAQRGQTVMGTVVNAQKAGHGNTSSQLAIALSQLSLVDGQPVPIRTELVEMGGGNPSRGRNEAAIVGTTTGTGAVIGAAAGGGTGAAIGAAIGAAAGVVGVLSTRGGATEIGPEAQLTFRLENPVTISTQQSRHAFYPVNPGDYNNRGPARNPERYPDAHSYPPPPPPAYYAPYGYGFGYGAGPYSYFNFYGYYGPYYYGTRVYVRPGYYHRHH